jgi:hypothetical protein
MKCTYCQNTFSNKQNLKHHQKTTKYCLDIQGKINDTFKCIYCSKILSTQYHLNIHLTSCVEYKLSIKLKDYETKIYILEETIKDQKKHIDKLEDKLENIALKAVSKPTTSITNMVNYIEKLEPLDDHHFAEAASHLTLEHIKKGAEGYAEYALMHPLKDRLVCVDYARRKVKFKNKDGIVITDPEMNTLTTKFFDSIWNQNRKLTALYGQELLERGDASDMEEIDKLISFGEGVRQSSEGKKTDLQYDWVKSVCSRTLPGE